MGFNHITKICTARRFLALLALGCTFVHAQLPEKPPPTFALSIEEDRNTVRFAPNLHRLLVHFTRVAPGAEIDMFRREDQGMYDMVVLHDGLPAPELPALRDLRNFRKVDRDHFFDHPRILKTGETWTTSLDLSDYFDMTEPGDYQVTVTRESLPLNLTYSTLVSSNTIDISSTAARQDQRAEKPKPRFELTASLEDPDTLFPLIVHVERTNISKSTIRERKCWTFMGMYNLIVRFNGEALPPNQMLRDLQKSRAQVDCSGNETAIEIEPGELDADDIPVSNFFDLARPGAYVVYVTRETYPWNPAKSVSVESNPISFVVPEPPPDTDAPRQDNPSPPQP